MRNHHFVLFFGLFGLGLGACASDDSASTDGGSDAAKDTSNGSDVTPGNDGGDGGTTIKQKAAETKLFADTSAGGAAAVDPNLVNAWGLAFGPTGVAWVADNGSGLLTLYDPAQTTPNALVVTVPPPTGMQGPAAPTGQVFNSATDFKSDLFIVSTEDGTISGWHTGTTMSLRVDNSTTSANYKGLTIVPSTPPLIVAANFFSGAVDVFDTNYAPVASSGAAWKDPNVAAGFGPFNVAALGSNVYVSWAMQDGQKHDDVAGAGHGAISVFDQKGTFIKTLVPSGGVLDSPWGMVLVPSGGWGSFAAGTLLVGDFGDGAIHAFDATSGALMGAITDASSNPLSVDGLWGLTFLNGKLYFTAGPNGEANGLFGYLMPQ